MEFSLLAAALTGMGATWVALRLAGHAARFDLLLGAAAVGMLAGRLASMVAAGVNPITNPLDILVIRGGVDTVTAAATTIVYLVWTVRADRNVLDAIAPAAVAGMAGWHVGCLWRDACLGAAGEVPWGWALPGSDIVRHPVEIYAAALMALGAVALVRLPGAAGRRAALALSVVAGARLVTEPLRPSLGGGLGWWYAIGVIAAIMVAAVLTLGLRGRADQGLSRGGNR